MGKARSGIWRRVRFPVLTAIIASFPIVAAVFFLARPAAEPARGTDEPLTIAVASNFEAPMRVLADRFQTSTGRRVVVVPGSTGKHFAQILNGAPFDLFFAADEQRPRGLEERGLAVAGTRFTYAVGRLVLWSPAPGRVDAEGRVLETARFRYLAMANPRLAPYGRAARQTLERRGLYEGLIDRLVLGENVAQAFQLVATGNAELGFIALAQLAQFDQPGRPVSGSSWRVPPALHDPIEQQAVLLRDTPAARLFLEHVQGRASRELIRRHGYENAPVGIAVRQPAEVLGTTRSPHASARTFHALR